jgi:hypothetical protein
LQPVKIETNPSVEHKNSIDPLKFGLSFGIVLSLFMTVFSLSVLYLGLGQPIMRIISSLYVGYSLSFTGILIGSFWSFLEGFLFGNLLAIIYNKLN